MQIIEFIIAVLIGVGAGYGIRQLLALKKIQSSEQNADRILETARTKEKEILLSAKDKALALIEKAKREEEDLRKELKNQIDRIERREGTLDQKIAKLEQEERRCEDQKKKIEEKERSLDTIYQEQSKKLERIAELPKEEAREQLLQQVENDAQEELISRMRKLEKQGADELQAKARTLLATVIERCASSHAVDTTTTGIQIHSDELKGRIIGKEGRNIKTIEQLTGVEVVVDETPGMIWVSGFSSIRRQVAKLTIEKLIQDGRIHPGRIEEAIDLAKKELSLDITKAGEDAAYEVGIVGLHPKIIQLLGRLKYRTSYGHNVLQHSVEVAFLSGLLAEELGADVIVAKKGGLLHDIGKSVDHEMQGSHPELGYEIMKKFSLPEEVAYISIAHHEDRPKTLEGVIVKAADAISGARPGARKDTYEQYVQRLEELEKIANQFQGVAKTYAIQAGREIRVFVSPDQVDDWAAHKLAKEIANKIERELKYPGEIRVIVIRETRVIEYAR